MLNFIRKLFGRDSKRVKSDHFNDLNRYFLREIEKSQFIRKDKVDVVLRHLNNEINLLKDGAKLTSEEKKELGLNPRLQLSHELLAVLNEDGLALRDPKNALLSITLKANFAKANDENIENYKKMRVTKYEVIGCKDNRDCPWCLSMDGKKLSVNQSLNELIEENCKCESHCRLTTVSVLS